VNCDTGLPKAYDYMEKLEYTSNSIISESLIRRTDNTIANKGHKEKKTNNGQQRTNREKDKQWSTKDKNRKRQTMVNKGQKQKKTNNDQQRTKREKDKQWSTKEKNRKRQTIVNK
jgi:hypothetical protein